jgi:hypothetical protein
MTLRQFDDGCIVDAAIVPTPLTSYLLANLMSAFVYPEAALTGFLVAFSHLYL